MPQSTTALNTTEAMRKVLASLWEKNLPILQERVVLLEAAAQAAETKTLTAEQRHEAASIAHKLAGSLGMFGRPKGTDLARVLEQSFDSPRPLEKAGLAETVAALRKESGL